MGLFSFFKKNTDYKDRVYNNTEHRDIKKRIKETQEIIDKLINLPATSQAIEEVIYMESVKLAGLQREIQLIDGVAYKIRP